MNAEESAAASDAAFGGLVDNFGSYHPPADDVWAAAYQAGLVVLDTNALLDLYRFSPQARQEYLDVLREVRERIFVPHQVALEFHRNRLSAVKQHRSDLDKTHADVTKLAGQLEEAINKLAKRNLSAEQLELARNSIATVRDLAASVIDDYRPTPQSMGSGNDPVIVELIELLDGRVALPPDPEVLAKDQAEGSRRFKERIPPGFADSEKEHGVNGDYLLWAEMKRLSATIPASVLLVTNDVTKGDWVFESGGVTIGAHQDLVAELKEETGQQFLISTVADFLRHAKKYLETSAVSASTVEEASELDFSSANYHSIPGKKAEVAEYAGAYPAAEYLGIPEMVFSELVSQFADGYTPDGLTFEDLVKVYVARMMTQVGFSNIRIRWVFNQLPARISEWLPYIIIFTVNGEVSIATEDFIGGNPLADKDGMDIIRLRPVLTDLRTWWSSQPRAINLRYTSKT